MRNKGWMILLFIAGCASKPVIKQEWIDPCVKIQEEREESDLKAYLAAGELVSVKDELERLKAKVGAFLTHPHTCKHKDLLR